jgi:hypothetical protein
MDLDTTIKRLQELRSQKGNLDVLYLVHSDTEQYSVDAVDVVTADEAVAERCGIKEDTEYVLIKSDSVW